MRGPSSLDRRSLLLGGAGVLGGAVLAGAGGCGQVRRAFGGRPDAYVPDAAEGRVRLETVSSAAMGRDLSLFTAVPAGHGDVRGLPVVVVLHGASASAGDFPGFGLGRFVTAAVQRGAAPFVLAGTDDGPSGWLPEPGSDPFEMLRDEMPGWLAERGHDGSRRAVWGWSRGGYGALRLAQADAAWAAAWALFSPAVSAYDPALEDLSALDGARLGVWCGTDDPFYDDVRAVVDRLPARPEITAFESGAAHTRVFWNDHTIDALQWLAGRL